MAPALSLPYDGRAAVRTLKRNDPVMAELIRKVGPLRLTRGQLRSPFEALSQSIVYQQLHGKAAATILGRVLALFPEGFTPEALLAAEPAALRGAGLSANKLRAMQDLATKSLDGTVPSARQMRGLSDEELVERLTEVRGIGRWTVEMLLIFRLGRPDVLPVGDYGVRKGFMTTYRKRRMPTPDQLAEHGERWRPFRSVAAWYLWRATELPKAV